MWLYRRRNRRRSRCRRSAATDETESGCAASVNLPLIAGIIAAILLSALWKPGIVFDIYGTPLALAEHRA